MNDLCNLPGVLKVEYCSESSNPSVNSIGVIGSYPIQVNGDFKELPLIGLAKLEINTDGRGNQAIADSKLHLTTTVNPLNPTDFYFFRITLVTGEQYLLGYYGYPAPTVKSKYTVSDKVTDARVFKITISWNCVLKPLLIGD